MLSATAHVSLKGTLETFLSWKHCRPNKPSSEMSHKKRDISNIVVTPDRIPKFFIPPLDVDHVLLHVAPLEDVRNLGKEPDALEKNSTRTKRSHSESNIKQPGLTKGKSLCRKASDYSFEDLEKVADHLDPVTRAALSLPHLSKITTPYGFLTLGEIPNIRRKESLFFDHSAKGQQMIFPEQRNVNPLLKKTSSPQRKHQSCKDHSKPARKPYRSVSWEVICHKADMTSSTLSSSTNDEEGPAKCEKTRFRLLMKKHLAGIKGIKLSSGGRDKIPLTVGRTQSNPIA